MEKKASTQHQQPEPQMERRASIGEKIFDWFTYFGVNGVGTFAVTVALADTLRYGKTLHAKYDKFLHGMEKLAPAIPKRGHETLLMTLILMQGGNLMLLPVTVLERCKVPISNWFNNIFGDKTDRAQIQEAPSPSFGNLLLSRMRAFGVIFMSFIGLEYVCGTQIKRFENAMGRAFSAFTGAPEKISQTMDVYKKELGTIVKDQQETIPSKSFRYGHLSALDVIATATASLLLYEGSHKMAKKAQLRKEGKLPNHAAHQWLDQEHGDKATDTAIQDDQRPGTVVRQAQHQAERVVNATEKMAEVS